jgi:hypothetical protein
MCRIQLLSITNHTDHPLASMLIRRRVLLRNHPCMLRIDRSLVLNVLIIWLLILNNFRSV